MSGKVRRDGIHLLRLILKITLAWGLCNVGYFYALPIFGYAISYNAEPFLIAAYFLFCALMCVVAFRKILAKSFTKKSYIWLYGVLSVSFAFGLALSLYAFSFVPVLRGPALAPYTDILFATPWYFLPKAVDVLLQQILIAVFLLDLPPFFSSMKRIRAVYAVAFGGAHVFLFALTGAPFEHAFVMTMGALLSAFAFPHLILKVRAGFLFSYMTHLMLYLLFAVILHTWPPPGYFHILAL